MPDPDATLPVLLSYAEGMAILWGDTLLPASGGEAVDHSAVSHRGAGVAPQRSSAPNR
jgi:hypothetical protein